MKAQLETDLKLPIVPMDDNTRAMLAYAASSEGRARIGQARLELQMQGHHHRARLFR